MYLCICNAIRESAVEQAVAAGVSQFAEFARTSGCASVCGTCREDAESLFQQALMAKKRSKPCGIPVLHFA
jgi:bacterioferritin-associated ferredoxin